jgi:hypothetical protein
MVGKGNLSMMKEKLEEEVTELRDWQNCDGVVRARGRRGMWKKGGVVWKNDFEARVVIWAESSGLSAKGS